MLKKPSIRPFLLLIFDGFGYSENTEFNAIHAANMPNWQKYWAEYPHQLISGSGHCVGLPDDQMGNSEVGHLNLGAGRVVYQDLTRIDESIRTKDFFNNPLLVNQIKSVSSDNCIHLMGLVSPGGVHSHENHLLALIDACVQYSQQPIYIHAFLDGRDCPPKSAEASLIKIENHLQTLGRGKIASIMGRYYAMDRDKRYERTEKAYQLLTESKTSLKYSSALQALQAAYERGETDEFVQPSSVILNEPSATASIKDGDVVIFFNFRSDRARQLSYAFLQKDFSGFPRNCQPQLKAFVSFTQYANDIPSTILFPAVNLQNSLGEYLSSLGLRQLRIAETEKYAHVTFFFNAGREEPYPLEDRVLIPSPKVATYDLQPEMSALEVTQKLIEAIQSGRYDFIVCNFANPDMVGHTGNFTATIKALEVLDDCFGKIVTAIQQVGGELLLTADHGNAEQMFDKQTQQAHTAHTSEPVPLLYIGRPATYCSGIEQGKLSDIAPTILNFMGLDIPKEMTGRLLFQLESI